MKYTYYLSGLAISFCLSQQVLAKKKPHIIFIITDQQREDALGCMGNDRIITPHLDSLAHDGSCFKNTYSSTPSSTPPRSGLLTGLSPWHHGMLGYGNVAEKYPYEMPQMLKDQGYLTLGIGKTHWQPQNATHGFHATILDESGRVESPYFMSDYRKWFQTVAPEKNPDLNASEANIPKKMDGKSLLTLLKQEKPSWRKWIDLEHNTCYSQDNYWCALTDGKWKHIWFLRTGKEQLFNLENDPNEEQELSGNKRYQKHLSELRQAMTEHLAERGEEWVKNGKLVIREKDLLYSPYYPMKQNINTKM